MNGIARRIENRMRLFDEKIVADGWAGPSGRVQWAAVPLLNKDGLSVQLTAETPEQPPASKVTLTYSTGHDPEGSLTVAHFGQEEDASALTSLDLVLLRKIAMEFHSKDVT